jgi:uncharacterized membrane protein (UPF0127 family)
MRRIAVGAVVAGLLVVAGGLAWGLGAVELPGEDVHDAAEVTVTEPDGRRLATLDVRVADSRKERVRGLSDADSLATGSGMLFVHPDAGNHSYVMRDMAFPLDIVFIAPCEGCPAGVDGRVTVVHHADVPTGEDSPRYTGDGRWVLEVNQGYADVRGIDAGDHVRIRYTDDE